MLTTFQRFGTPMEDPTTEIPQLPVMNAEVLRDLPPELRVRSTAGSSSLQDWTRMYGGMTPDWPPGAPPPPLMHQPQPEPPYYHPHSIYPAYGTPYMSHYMAQNAAPQPPSSSQLSPSVDRLHQGLDGMHLEPGAANRTPPYPPPDPRHRGHSPIPPPPPYTHNFHSFPNIVGNTYHPPSDSGTVTNTFFFACFFVVRTQISTRKLKYL